MGQGSPVLRTLLLIGTLLGSYLLAKALNAFAAFSWASNDPGLSAAMDFTWLMRELLGPLFFGAVILFLVGYAVWHS